MRDLMNEATVVPPWLHDTFLGYGDPAAAQYSKLPEAFVRTIDFKVSHSHVWLVFLAPSQPVAVLGFASNLSDVWLKRDSAQR